MVGDWLTGGEGLEEDVVTERKGIFSIQATIDPTSAAVVTVPNSPTNTHGSLGSSSKAQGSSRSN